jgi:[acyl-carrier-protein] S-malonyltransferase
MTDWTKTAFVFPGQGSQKVGMGKDFAAAYPIAKQVFEQADDVLGFSLSTLCFDGPANQLNDTINTQPALFVCSAAILKVLQEEQPDAQSAFVAGHSMGELTALMAAGAMEFEDGLKLVRERGRLMKEAGVKSPGAMAAILGLNSDVVDGVCETATAQVGKPVVLANDNCPGQIVISGDSDALDVAMTLAQEQGARRTVKLAVSIAAHSPLMASAAADFQKVVAAIPFQDPDVPVYGNITAQPLASVPTIQEELGGQLTKSVQWTNSMQAMIAAGAEHFIEIGSGDVLTGLMKRIDRKKTRIALNSVEALQKFLGTNES